MYDFTIIIPAYNMEQYIGKTIESVCKNQLDRVQILVVDDGSKDHTGDLCEKLLGQYNAPCFQVIRQKNGGVSAARNTGIQNAGGKYLIFCDGDDFCDDDLIETLHQIQSPEQDMIMWKYRIQDGSQSVRTQGNYSKNLLTSEEALEGVLLKQSKIRLGSFAVKKSLITESGIMFTENCSVGEDMEFIYKCLIAAKTVYFLDDTLFTYVKRTGSAMNRYSLKRFEAPYAMGRVYDFLVEKEIHLNSPELNNYMQNGLIVLHSMFAFDACIRYLYEFSEARQFSKEYFEKYQDLEKLIQKSVRAMKVLPPVMSKKRIIVFKLSRALYIYLYVYLNRKRTGK